MAVKPITVDCKVIFVEVADLVEERPDGFEYTSRDEDRDMGDRIRDLVGVLTMPVQAAFEGSGAQEWAIEVNLGFNGETGLPFVVKAETNASVKVSAKWNSDRRSQRGPRSALAL
ncbi:MAG: hypothetical protein LJE70_09265 [Chromatiaceae bacterium]|nr:hypothetical protein [Chromatiaceae bacterium]